MANKRYTVLDIIRGLTLISMITFHTVWDMVYIFGEDWDWYKSEGAYFWQQSICWSFILLSGFCWSLGKKKLKRGIVVFLAGAVVSGVTLIAMPENRILFGVLTMLGSSMLFMIPVEKCMKRVNPYLGIIIAFLVFLYTRNSDMGYWGLGKIGYVRLPGAWYSNMFSAYMGFPENGFYSTDYFGIFPWFYLFLTGYFGYKIFERKQWFSILSKGQCKILESLGKNSLIVYMLHQPLAYLVLSVVYRI